MLLLPTIRHAIGGPTPMGIIDAPVIGTGQSLLVNTFLRVSLGGHLPGVISPDRGEEEIEKMIVALLIQGRPVVYFVSVRRNPCWWVEIIMGVPYPRSCGEVYVDPQFYTPHADRYLLVSRPGRVVTRGVAPGPRGAGRS